MSTAHNATAVVTGASSGIGEAIALALAAQGTRLCLVGRRLDALQAVADAAMQRGAQADCFQADLAVDDEVGQLVSRLRQTGGVDILVHAAGAICRDPLERADPQELDRLYRTNVRAPYVLTQGLLPQLMAARGQVVFVNSTAGLVAGAGTGQYAASKHALKALADSLRDEVNPAGVRVLSLFLGRTATPMQQSVHGWEGRPYRPELLMQPQEVAAVTLHALALPRSVEVTEIRMRPMVRSY